MNYLKARAVLILTGVWVLSACQPASPNSTEVISSIPTGVKIAVGELTPTAQLQPTLGATDQPEANIPQATETPVISTELHATNPSTVNLATGEVQLVEFFAFW